MPLVGTVRALLKPHHYSQVDLMRALYLMLGYEVVVLLLFVWMLRKHPDGFRDLSLHARFIDLPISIGLMVGAWFASYFVTIIVYGLQYAITGHQPQPREFQTALDTGLNLGTGALLLINPFFEEWIFRGFLMREVEAFSGKVGYAIFVSVFVQALYHTYQGVPAALAIGSCFLVLSLYYAKTKRIVPVILAHLYWDVFAMYLYMSRH